jgi:hypothetical protein
MPQCHVWLFWRLHPHVFANLYGQLPCVSPHVLFSIFIHLLPFGTNSRLLFIPEFARPTLGLGSKLKVHLHRFSFSIATHQISPNYRLDISIERFFVYISL